jgi:protein TonB
MINEAPLAPEIGSGVFGGVYGGVPGASLEGALAEMLGGMATSGPAPPPVEVKEAKTEEPRAPIRVGGRVRPPHALHQPHPIYPRIAKRARVAGDVVITSTIDTEGNVVDMQAVSGPPLLYEAALEALAQWKFEPTYLDDKPVAIILNVTIHFEL